MLQLQLYKIYTSKWFIMFFSSYLSPSWSKSRYIFLYEESSSFTWNILHSCCRPMDPIRHPVWPQTWHHMKAVNLLSDSFCLKKGLSKACQVIMHGKLYLGYNFNKGLFLSNISFFTKLLRLHADVNLKKWENDTFPDSKFCVFHLGHWFISLRNQWVF